MKLPNGSKAPALIQLIQWIVKPLQYLDECEKRYGDIFTVRLLGFPPLVFVANPQGIQEIFSADVKKFDVGRTNYVVRPFFGDRSLILYDSDRHKQARKLLMPPFHGEKVKFYAESIRQITEKVAQQWQPNQPFIARDAMQNITLEVILQVIFGLSKGDRYQKIKPIMAEWLDITASPVGASFIFLKLTQGRLSK